jgi:pimeloyl-ACP methyl ester carboxylesterase
MYVDRESATITRHFVNFGDRQLHFRMAGTGPALLLLHQSPTSSAEMASQLETLAAEFTVIAPDLPGYGLSDPLPTSEPDMAPFADAVSEFLDVLGLEKVCAYGFHTGAMLAAELAFRHPQRLTAAIIDGLVVLTEQERQDFMAKYFQKAPPQPEGGHLPFYWARIRDQLVFFPWYRKDHSVRMGLDLPPAAALQPFVLDLLRTRSKLGYRAAFAYPTEARAAQWHVPVFLLNFEADPICHHVERISAYPDCVTREILPDPDALTARATEIARQYAPAPVDVPRQSRGHCTRTVSHEMVQTPVGPVHRLRRDGDPQASHWLILHEPGSAAGRWSDLLAHWPLSGSVTAIDLPGHGDTGNIHVDDFGAAAQMEVVAAAMADTTQPLNLIGTGLSANIALEFAQLHPQRVASTTLIEPWLFEAAELRQLESRYAPPLSPRDYGQHLLEAWYWVRDGQLFWPWFDTRDARGIQDSELDPGWLHDRTVELLQSADHLRSAVWALMDYDLEAALKAHAGPIWIMSRGTSELRSAAAKNAANIATDGRYEVLPAAEQAWGSRICELIESP